MFRILFKGWGSQLAFDVVKVSKDYFLLLHLDQIIHNSIKAK